MSKYVLSSMKISLLRDVFPQVNIVPIIAKADSLTADECQSFKKQVSKVRLVSS